MNRIALFDYVRRQFGVGPEHLWRKQPDYAVLRRTDNAKWFAVVMAVPGGKLGLKTDAKVDIVNVKVRPEHVGSLRCRAGILPAYHMNKEHWISVQLAGPLTAPEITQLLADSYALTAG